ncbi:hypothetical protein [Klebsiella pneumoniae]|uniref:hypothetical protein n=1 Tax=Klebsiella pneumoniae TaxID=573 RepID=UPI000451BC10|nr:hypothetical protein [Klebsiella pneumoniae]ELB6486199.1 hypothetical protein [Raoultella ornithinolytica]EMB2528903.1 hypothetical protein [Klebsiella pneumoniae]EZR09618.1 hypothetical protein AE23_04666 [Klebsiella pneumoniae UCI 64]MCQ8604042.1 hypothetical protein [Klebsiella pneumoniae]MDU2909122.1 hypothetical protein [Klebsiella pneumoniae]
MNIYYIDPSQTENGNGEQQSPFNSVNAAFNSGLSYPWTVLIRRGTTTRERLNDTNRGFLNNAGRIVPCYFGSYGDGPRPKWIQDTPAIQCIYSNKATNVQIRGIDFIDCDIVPAWDTGALIHLTAYGDKERNYDANLYAEHCGFYGNEKSVTAQWGGNQRIKIFAAETSDNLAHKIGVAHCDFDTVSSCVYIRGNTQVEDVTTNLTGDKKSMGVFCANNSFHRVVQSAILFHSVKSEGSAYVRTEYSSYMEENSYSSYRWDKVSPEGARHADAAMWVWHSDRVMIRENWIAGMLAMANDGMAFDIDGMSWGNVVRHNFSTGNVSFAMLISASGAGLSPWEPDKYSYEEWFYHRRMGTGENIIEYNFSFNDAIQRLRNVPEGKNYNSEIYASVLRNAKCLFDNHFRNNTIIDTVSDKRKLLLNSNAYSGGGTGVPALSIDNNIFYCRWLTEGEIFEHNLYTNDKASSYQGIATPDEMLLRHNIIFMEEMPGFKPDMSKFKEEGNIFSSPQFLYVPRGAPVNARAAKMMKFRKSSPALGGGMRVATPDINGISGNNIGWLQ